MAMGLVGAFGAQGGANAVKALREELLKRFMLQQELEQQGFENQRKLTAEDFTRQRLSEDTRQFDASLGLNRDKLGFEQQQYTEAAPLRAANLRHVGLQSDKLAREPQDTEAERAFLREMQGTKTQDELGLIDARTRGQLRVINSRPPAGEDLDTFEKKEQIKAKYSGSRPSLGAERQSLAYYNRAKQASDDIGGMEEQMAQAGIASQLQQQYAPNMLQTDAQQTYRQAQRAFTEARLRKESGAAIPQGEYDNDARTYFAQPGDSPAVIAQKRKARAVVLEGLKFSSGKAYDEFYGQPGEPAAAQEFDFVPGKGLVPRKR